MTEDAVATSARAGPWLAGCLGLAAGTAAQLQQGALWPLAAYAALVAGGFALALLQWRRGRAWGVLVGVALLAFGLVGLRALAFQSDALDPMLQGRDLLLTGRVSAMPQPGDIALRLRLDVESAEIDGRPVRVPARVELSWYRGRLDDVPQQQAGVLAGDRWRLQVRLRAPHGQRNPHGFDYELWQWERGVQATGYVRAGPRDAAPQLLARGWRHPVERARQAVREAIFARVAEPARAGLVAALAMGDQAAVERADWDLFRATGTAHLLAVSGIQVTLVCNKRNATWWYRLDAAPWRCPKIAAS